MITIKFENETLPIRVSEKEVKEYEINGEIKIFGIGPFSTKSNIEVKDKQTGKIVKSIQDVPILPFFTGAFTVSINAVQEKLKRDGIFVVKSTASKSSSLKKADDIITIPINIENKTNGNIIVQKLKGEVKFKNLYIGEVRGPTNINLTITEIDIRDKNGNKISLRNEQVNRAIRGALTKIVMNGEIGEKELAENIVTFLNVEYENGDKIEKLLNKADDVLDKVSLQELEEAIKSLIDIIENKSK